MIYFAERYGMTSQKTVDCSQELDRLLNVIWHVHTDFQPNQTFETHVITCVFLLFQKTHILLKTPIQ